MAGNKALKKFLESKIPKKGSGKPLKEINIYKEPNTHSEVVGKIKEGEMINWISKSICDNREWMRCDKNQNFGYVIGTEENGNTNFDTKKIEKTKEKKNPIFLNNDTTLTKEEIKLGDDALNEILNEDDDLKNNNNIDINDKSTEGEDSFEKTINILNEENKFKDFNDIDYNNLDFKSAINLENKKSEEILGKIVTELEKEEEQPKIIEMPKKEEKPSKLRKVATFIADLIPGFSNVKSGCDAIFGKDIITREKLDTRERIMSAISLIPGVNYAKKAVKISKCLSITNKASKTSKAMKSVKNIDKNIEKKMTKDIGKNADNNDVIKKIFGDDKNIAQEKTFHAALRRAKRDNNIPKGNQIIEIKPNLDRRGNKQPGAVLKYKDVNNRDVNLRLDIEGHDFPKEKQHLGSHINGDAVKNYHCFYPDKDKGGKYFENKVKNKK